MRGEDDCKVVEEGSADFVFRLGCLWGDDGSWKIDLLKLPTLESIKCEESMEYEEYFGDSFSLSTIDISEDDGRLWISWPKLIRSQYDWR